MMMMMVVTFECVQILSLPGNYFIQCHDAFVWRWRFVESRHCWQIVALVQARSVEILKWEQNRERCQVERRKRIIKWMQFISNKSTRVENISSPPSTLLLTLKHHRFGNVRCGWKFNGWKGFRGLKFFLQQLQCSSRCWAKYFPQKCSQRLCVWRYECDNGDQHIAWGIM